MQRGLDFKRKSCSTQIRTQTHSFFRHSHSGNAEHPRLGAAFPWRPSILHFMWFSELGLPCHHFWGVICLISPHHPRARGGAPWQPGCRRCWVLFCRSNRASPHPPAQPGSHPRTAAVHGLALPCLAGNGPQKLRHFVTPSRQPHGGRGAGGRPVSPHAGCDVCGVCVLLEGWIWDSRLCSEPWCTPGPSASHVPFLRFHGRLKNHQESAGRS